jgi:hypothetical protein
MKNEGGRRLATGHRWFPTVAINVCLIFNAVVVILLFLFCKDQLLGDFHEHDKAHHEHDHLTYNPPILLVLLVQGCTLRY